MNQHKSLLLKIEILMAFIDLKIILLVWILADLYRNTVVLEGITRGRTDRVANVLEFVWNQSGSLYLFWVPAAILGDIMLKKTLRHFTE